MCVRWSVEEDWFRFVDILSRVVKTSYVETPLSNINIKCCV